MNYVKTIGQAFRWYIHKIVNESAKHQLETTFYTGTDLWKPRKGLMLLDEKKSLRRLMSMCERGNQI